MSKEASQVRLASLIYLEEWSALHKGAPFLLKKYKVVGRKIGKPRLRESRKRAAEGCKIIKE